MARLDEQRLRRDYRAELQRVSLCYAPMVASVAILVMGLVFVNDYFRMRVGLLSFTRLVAFIPCILYMVLWPGFLRKHRHYAIVAHATVLLSLMISAGLFSVGLFRLGLARAAYGAAGTMQTAILGVFVFSNGVRKYLWAIIGIPLALTLMSILVCCTPSRLELTLFYTPFIMAIGVMAVSVSQSRMAARSFRMSRLMELQKDELEEKAEALQLANNELQQFASVVAHDLKVPLHSIRTTLQLMDARVCEAELGNAEVFEQMEFVTGTADRMNQMIAGMLSYACLENCSDQFQRVPLDDVLETVKRTLKQSIEEHGAEIETDPLPEVWGDRMQLTTLLQELLVNAIKYRKPGVAPRVTLSSDAVGDNIRVLIADNGIGFDAKHKRAVFKPYQQLKTHARNEGSGIGLASCAKIVKLHGGTIGVEPVLGQGSTFYFTLPKNAPS